jgi:hypothetical protein
MQRTLLLGMLREGCCVFLICIVYAPGADPPIGLAKMGPSLLLLSSVLLLLLLGG